MAKESKQTANLKENYGKVKTSDGKGLTKGASMYQKGSPFQKAQSLRFKGFAGENIEKKENNEDTSSFFSGGVVGKIRSRMKKGKK